VPLREGVLIDAEVGPHVVGPTTQPPGDGPLPVCRQAGLIPQASSQVRRSSPAAPVTEHARSTSMAQRSACRQTGRTRR
jgi:hypothetical protein